MLRPNTPIEGLTGERLVSVPAAVAVDLVVVVSFWAQLSFSPLGCLVINFSLSLALVVRSRTEPVGEACMPSHETERGAMDMREEEKRTSFSSFSP